MDLNVSNYLRYNTIA